MAARVRAKRPPSPSARQADPAAGWGPVLSTSGVTIFGSTRVRSATGSGGIFCHALEVQDNQKGCLRFCWFAAETNRLPQNFGCVTGVKLQFGATTFGEPAYGQLSLGTDQQVRRRVPTTTKWERLDSSSTLINGGICRSAFGNSCPRELSR